MPRITGNSRNSFDSLISSVRSAERDVRERLKEAVKTGAPAADQLSLIEASVELSDELQRISDLELDYMASAKGVSDAEKELAQGAQDARGHVKAMKSVASAIQGAADVAAVIKRLLASF